MNVFSQGFENGGCAAKFEIWWYFIYYFNVLENV